MSVTDVMSGARLTLLPQVALLLFLAAYAAVTIRVALRTDRSETEAASRLPLDDHPRLQ